MGASAYLTVLMVVVLIVMKDNYVFPFSCALFQARALVKLAPTASNVKAASAIVGEPATLVSRDSSPPHRSL